MALIAIVLVILAIVVPGFLRACCGGEESGIIGTLRAINSSQQAYASSCSNGKYASTFADLRKPPLGGGTPFIFEGAETGVRHGYRVTMHTPDAAPMEKEACNGVRVGATTYFVEAHYIDPKVGRRNFATDEKGTIYQTTDGTVIQPGMAGAQPIQ